MNIVKKMSKKKLLETYKNNYELMLNRKNELYNKNIELQKKIIEQEDIINDLKKEKKVLKAKLTKALKQIDRFESIEVGRSIEQGNYIVENLFKEGDK